MAGIRLRIVILSGFFLSAGCATLLSQREYPIYVMSTPEGAEVDLICGQREPVTIGKTPFTYNWDPERHCSLRFRKADHADVSEVLHTELNTTAIANCGSPAYIFIPIDWYTESYLRPREAVIEGKFQPDKTNESPEK